MGEPIRVRDRVRIHPDHVKNLRQDEMRGIVVSVAIWQPIGDRCIGVLWDHRKTVGLTMDFRLQKVESGVSV